MALGSLQKIFEDISKRLAALETTGPGAVQSVFGRQGNVVGESGDYSASFITTTVTDKNVQQFLDDFSTRITALENGGGSGAVVDSVFGRTGAVAAQDGDYNASQITMNESDVETVLNDLLSRLSSLENNPYVLPQATDTTLGGIKTGATLVTDENGTNVRLLGKYNTGIGSAGTGLYAAADGSFGVNLVNDPTEQLPYGGGLKADWDRLWAKPASKTELGSVVAGDGLAVDSNGVLSVTGGGSGGGDVSSVFGRTGTVTAQDGDYTAAQITANSTSNVQAELDSLDNRVESLENNPPELPVASSTVLGGVKIGSGINIADDGTISASGGSSGQIPIATKEILGGVLNSNSPIMDLNIKPNGELSVDPTYSTIVFGATSVKPDANGSLENPYGYTQFDVMTRQKIFNGTIKAGFITTAGISESNYPYPIKNEIYIEPVGAATVSRINFNIAKDRSGDNLILNNVQLYFGHDSTKRNVHNGKYHCSFTSSKICQLYRTDFYQCVFYFKNADIRCRTTGTVQGSFNNCDMYLDTCNISSAIMNNCKVVVNGGNILSTSKFNNCEIILLNNVNTGDAYMTNCVVYTNGQELSNNITNSTIVGEPSGSEYVLPAATNSTLGGVKVGNGIDVSADGTISVSGGSTSVTDNPTFYAAQNESGDGSGKNESNYIAISALATKLFQNHYSQCQVYLEPPVQIPNTLPTIPINFLIATTGTIQFNSTSDKAYNFTGVAVDSCFLGATSIRSTMNRCTFNVKDLTVRTFNFNDCIIFCENCVASNCDFTRCVIIGKFNSESGCTFTNCIKNA